MVIDQKGSLMVEALALLGLITMVTPILYKKAAERTTELQDINVATQMRMVSNAVDNFIKDNYNEVGDAHPEDVFKLNDDELEKLNEYLPYGFSTQRSKMFEDFDVSVRKRTVVDVNDNEHNIYTAAVLAPLRDDITIMRASKIASMIGANGGVYRYSGEGDDGPQYKVEGVQGTWQATLGDYGLGDYEGIKEGSLVVISNEAIASARGDVSSDDVLYRIDDGDENKNTMQTTLYMDGNEIRDVSELIASAANGSNVTIGREGDNPVISNLIVTGTTNLKNTLTVAGDTTLKGALTVDGDTELKNTTIDGTLTVTGNTALKNTTITGNLTQSGGDVSFTPGKFTVNATGDVSIGGKNVAITGAESASIKVGDKGLTVNKNGNTISGNTTIENGDLIINGGDIIVNPEGEEDTSILADWLYANKGIKVGGKNGNASPGNYFTADSTGVNVNAGDLKVNAGALDVRSNFYADGDKVEIENNSFAVGGKINIDNSSAFIGNDYKTDGSHVGLLVESGSLVLRNADGSLAMKEDETTLESGNSRIKLGEDIVTIGTGTKGEENAKIVADANKVGFENKGAGDTGVDTLLYLENGRMKFGVNSNTQILADEYGLAIAGKGGNLTGNSVKVSSDGSIDSVSILDGAKVAISREGIIEVKAPTVDDNDGGYIRARRLVSDIPYPDTAVFDGYTASGGTPSKGYDYYQVNPAYTSVMNDIKLASRGGARLSDILPDFINKGIYVVDNTYKSDSIGDWTNLNVVNGKVSLSEGSECTTNTCIASPWMGFVPAPQCPKNYAKVIAMHPIRWRMSEVYAVYNTDEWPEAGSSAYQEIISGSNFGKYFAKQNDPRYAEFALTSVAGGDEEHTHVVETGAPLTFQTNTWLNTTITENFGGKNTSGTVDNFQGWHAIMGFVYRPTQYRQLLEDLGQSISTTDIYWNIFPVYAQDMAAIANVYCYFDRHPLTTGNSRKWTWGSSPVYQYDQLNNYRLGYDKGASGDANAWGTGKSEDDGSYINDPTLGYDDAW